jgi:hydroxymethylpyrimidine pyrophosphatase-like HAD family hydrolase
MKRWLLFDIDGTLARSGQRLETEMVERLQQLVKLEGYELVAVGGGVYTKIGWQLGDALSSFSFVFSECGCVLHDRHGVLLSTRSLKTHPLYPMIDRLIKKALHFLSTVDYELTGHLIDRRSGLVYISLIGMTADEEERRYFLALDHEHHYITRLLDELITECPPGIDIVKGGSVGIAIYPTEWDKEQVLEFFPDMSDEIHYVGDRHQPGGNDHRILHHPRVHGHPTDSPQQTLKLLRDNF